MKVEVKKSKQFAGILLGLHLGAIISIGLSPLFWLVKFLLIIPVMIHFVCVMKHYVLLTGAVSICTINMVDNNCTLYNAAKQSMPAVLLGSSYVGRWIMILNFSLLSSNQTKTAILFKDSCDKNSWRQLQQFPKYWPL